jgi:uncharacterized OB-fold protein
MSAVRGSWLPSRGQTAVLCPKCGARNDPVLLRCSECGADLLPGRSVRERVVVLILGMVLAELAMALAVYVASQGLPVPPYGSPIVLAVLSLALFVAAVQFGLVRTPVYQRYLNRAKRLRNSDPEQALSDLSQALMRAPNARKALIQKERSQLLTRLGRTEQPPDELTAQGASAPAGTGGQQKQPSDQGAWEWIGYCKSCRAMVHVDPNRRCARCGARATGVEFVRPEQREAALAQVFDQEPALRLGPLVSGALTVVGFLVLIVLPSAALMPRLLRHGAARATAASHARVSATATSRALALATPVLFQEDVFSFSYASDWQQISSEQASSLLKRSLSVLLPGPYSYIGGVYTGGLDDCQGCAQVLLAVSSDPHLPATLTDEQYEAWRTTSAQALGARLLSYNKVELSSMPAVECVHLGLSDDSKQWDYVIVSPQGGAAYLLSFSSQQDSFADFEPVFRLVLETLRIVPPTPTLTATVTPTRRPTARPTHTPTATPVPTATLTPIPPPPRARPTPLPTH